jgi:hypothetical protein
VHGGVDAQSHIFLTSALAEGEWSASHPGPGERAPGIQWIGGWVDTRAGLNEVEKRKFFTLLGLELQPLGSTAHSQSLYRLCYPSFLKNLDLDTNTDLSASIFGKFQITPFALCSGKKTMQCIRITRLATLA